MLEPIRVALVITELRVGGAERCLANLALRLDPRDFTVRVFALQSRPPADADALVRELEAARLPIEFLDARSIFHLPRVVGELRRQFVRHKTEVVQSFLYHANVLSALAIGNKETPRLSTGIRVADPSQLRHYLERRATQSRAERIVCVSDAVRRFAVKAMKLPERKLTCIPNGIAAPQIDAVVAATAARMGLAAGRRAITFVGRLHRQKNVETLIEAAPRFLPPLAQHDLLIVGDGPERTQLAARAAATAVADRIHFLGYCADAVAILKSSDLLVLPSRWEGLPNVVLEAMACGLPIVTSRAEGTLELLGAYADPQTFPIGGVDRMTELICRLATDTQASRRLGDANRDRALRHFSLEKMVASYAELFRVLAGR